MQEQSEDRPPLTLYLVKQLELAIRALMDDALRPFGLTTLQYTALSVLQTRGATSSAQLARRAFLRPQTMHEMVLTLEKRGYLRREADPANKRVLLATLTADGRELLERCSPAIEELESALVDELPPAEREAFRAGLKHGISALTALATQDHASDDRPADH